MCRANRTNSNTEPVLGAVPLKFCSKITSLDDARKFLESYLLICAKKNWYIRVSHKTGLRQGPWRFFQNISGFVT